MPSLNISILHLLPTSEALVQMQNLVNSLRYDEKQISHVSQKWNGNEGEFKLMFKRFTLMGTIKVQEYLVVITANLPFGLYFFRRYISKVIKERAVRLLSELVH
jgi:hypothetical protein